MLKKCESINDKYGAKRSRNRIRDKFDFVLLQPNGSFKFRWFILSLFQIYTVVKMTTQVNCHKKATKIKKMKENTSQN